MAKKKKKKRIGATLVPFLFYPTMPNLRYSAANTSRVNKKNPISPIKKHKTQLKKILTQQERYKQNLKKNELSPSPNITKTKEDEKLVIENYDVQLDFQLSSNDDILVAIDTILENQWAESTFLHSRFYSNEIVEKTNPKENLLFLLSGLSMETKAEIIKYRKAFLSEGLVTLNQLYSIYDHQGQTFVDRSLEIKIRQGKLKKFIITNASPIISRSPQKWQSGKTTYGFENAEVIAKTQDYLNLIKRDITKLENSDDDFLLSSLKKFHTFVENNPTSLFIGENELLNKKELSSLVRLGYVTLTSNHLNEIESHHYSISYPNCGTFLKLINSGRSWLVKLLTKTKFKQILEESLFNKWEGLNSQGTNKMNNFRKPFYGYDLHWILADSLGAGIIEVFNTPVGRGWQLTGKL